MIDLASSVLAALDRCGAAMLEWVLWMNLWTAGLLVLALLLDRALKQRVAASWRLVLLLAVVARLAVPISAQSPIGALAVGPSTGTSAPATGPRAAPEGASDTHAPAPPATVEGAAVRVRGANATPLALVPLGYGAGVVLLLVAWWRAARRLRGTLAATHAAGGARAATVAREIPRLDSARVRVHPSSGPLLIGIVRPTLVIPERLFTTLGGEALSAVLRHERAHLDRRDALLAALLHAVVIAAWPIAAVWIAVARARTLIELACDERALEGRDARIRADYGRALLAFATGGRAPSAALSFAGGLPERITALKAPRRWHRAAQIGVVAPVAAVLVACAAQRAPEAGGDSATDGRFHPTIYRSATPEAHKGSHELQFTVLDGVPQRTGYAALALTAATDERASPSMVVPSSEFDEMRAQHESMVLAQPRAYAILGLPFSLTVGSTGSDARVVTGIEIDARVAMIVKEPGATAWTYQLEVRFSERRDGAIVADLEMQKVSVHPGETAVILARGRSGHGDRLVCVAAQRAAPDSQGPADASAPPARQVSRSPGSAPAPFDPLDGAYPQVLWMLNVYEVPGAVEVAGNGRVTSTSKAKPVTFASIAGSDFAAALASIQSIAGQRHLAAPALLEKFDVDGVIEAESRDKAGQRLPSRSILIRTALAESGVIATFEVTVGTDGFSVSAHDPDNPVQEGGAVIMATPGPRSTDPWTILVARPSVLRSVRDYPFQTDAGPGDHAQGAARP